MRRRLFSNWASVTQDLPVVVGAVHGAGRGLFAVLDLPLTQRPLFSSAPVACHPPLLEKLSSRCCPSCLRPVANSSFCSPHCAASPWAAFSKKKPEQAAVFESVARKHGSVFALLAGRVAASAAAGTAQPDVLDSLCFANMIDSPPDWEEQFVALQALFGPESYPWLTLPWFSGVLARLHLNAFRVDIPRFDVSDVADIALQLQHGAGTAIYGLPSLLNHSCEPNLDAVWRDGDAKLSLICRRPISAGEELTITYIDSGAPLADRRAELQHAYGFTCRCEMCLDEELDT
jgi:hypothetical protein